MASNPDGQAQDTWHIRKGATFTKTYEWKQGTTQVNTPVDLTGYTIRSMIKNVYEGDVLVSLTSEVSGGIVVDPLVGKFTLTITPAMTENLDVTKGVFDVELVIGTVVKNLVGGEVKFYKEVTK